jgi:hypothetical protein
LEWRDCIKIIWKKLIINLPSHLINQRCIKRQRVLASFSRRAMNKERVSGGRREM